MLANILIILVAYLLGSVPSAVWIGKRFYNVDVRKFGSKNAGATNTFRILGKKAAFVVFLLDFFKGFTAVSLAGFSSYFHNSDPMFNFKIILVVAVVLGHIFPIFAGFKGGKGVATLAGATLGLYPLAVLLCLLTFLVVFSISKYVSLSSMTAGVMLPIFVIFVFHERSTSLIVYCCLVAILLLFTHRKNIKRLLNHTESKIFLFPPKQQ